MNGLEQKQRFTAVSRVETRLDDVELLLHELALQMVKDHEAIDRRFESTASLIGNLEHDDLEHERVIVRLRPLAETTFLQRLSWLFTGRT